MKKNYSLTGLLFFIALFLSCNSNPGDRPALDSSVQINRGSVKETIFEHRFTIEGIKFGTLEVGKCTFQDVRAEYPELTVDTVDALEHELEHYLSRKSYWFRKGDQVSFILILGIDSATGDTVEAVEVRSPEFQTQTGIKTGMSAKELLKTSPDIKISQGEIEYENCEIVNDTKEGLTYYFNTEWGKRIGKYQYEEDSETASELLNNLDTPIYQIYLFAPLKPDGDYENL